MRRVTPQHTVRLATGLWIVWAVVVWNVILDQAIVVAGRHYLEAAMAAASGSGPYVRMDDWMRPAVAHGFWVATAAGVGILVIGLGLIRSVRQSR